ncbi:MAG TPA: hypothetical protein VJJ76_00040 [archaeon]|nr:hypothetical protein [archaeon]
MGAGGKVSAVLAVVVVIFGIIGGYAFYASTIYPLDQGVAWISRAQTAGHATEMIENIQNAQQLLQNKHGNPAWWFPTSLTDWDRINNDLSSQKARLQEINSLRESNPDAYQQGLDDVRGKLRVTYEQMESTISWEWISPIIIFLYAVVIILAVVLFAIALLYWD